MPEDRCRLTASAKLREWGMKLSGINGLRVLQASGFETLSEIGGSGLGNDKLCQGGVSSGTIEISSPVRSCGYATRGAETPVLYFPCASAGVAISSVGSPLAGPCQTPPP